jgi:ABC-2 type transport system ATP-binding protein
MSAAVTRDITKRFGRRRALSDVTLEISGGEILGLVGPNGAGKTTLLRIMARLLRPSSGYVGTAEHVRYFAGEHSMPPTVYEGRWRRLWSAPALAGRGRRLGTLSRGTRQRVGLESMLADRSTELMLLDEPWEGLDPDASRWLSAELRQRRAGGTAVVVSSHRVHDLADVCDRCVFIVGGTLAPQAVTAAQLSKTDNRSSLLFEAFDRVKPRKR